MAKFVKQMKFARYIGANSIYNYDTINYSPFDFLVP
jgi:hypothetical protein